MDVLRGTVKSFDGVAYTATVQVTGSVPTFLGNVKVSRAIPTAEMVVGRGCAVLFFDPANPAEAVVLGVWT